MNTSGLIFDVYDDVDGTVLRTIYSGQDAVPDLVKVAACLAPEDLDKLPDDAFALVLSADTDYGTVYFRKYACIDPGNTALSVEYFLRSGRNHLDAGSRKVAAGNLLQSCEWFDVPAPEELHKEAGLGMMALNTAVRGPEIAGAYREAKRNLAAANLAPPGTIMTGHERERILKSAEMAGACAMQGPQASFGEKPKATSKVKKGGIDPYSVARKPDGNHVRPEPKYAALRGKYPLHTADHVKVACEYFEEYASLLPLDDRREYCLNVVKRAGELGVLVTEKVATYGATGYAPPHVLAAGIELRKMNVVDSEKRAELDALHASIPVVEPGVYCGALFEFDKQAGIDSRYHVVPDPYLSTFGEKKSTSFSEKIGSRSVDEKGLRTLASSEKMAAFTKTFGRDVADEFRRDPIGIFSSMPREQKQLIMRMADEG